MPQGRFGKPPLGVVYNTSMNRPDAALALAELYSFEGKRDSRMGSICVVGSGLQTAIFCDMVGRVYMPGPTRNGNQVLAVGLADVKPLPPDSPMVKPALERKNDKGEPAYVHSIERVSDTSLAEAVLLNGVIAQADAAVILSAPATYLAKSLNLNNAKELYKDKCRRLVIVDAGVPQQDVPAIRKVIAEWPSPIFFCSKEVGDALPFPGSALEKAFEWSPLHPVVDAYNAAGKMPYNAPSYDLAAAHFAVHPDSGFFQLSEAGSLVVSDDGKFTFKPGGGQVQSLKVDPAKKEALMLAMIDVLGTKPAAPQQRTRPPAANANTAKAADGKAGDPKAGGETPAAKPADPAAPGVIKKDK
jgi:hypothetical protein